MNAIELELHGIMPGLFTHIPQCRDRGVDDSGAILQGQRNDTLSRMAGGMRRQGFGADVIFEALVVTNVQRCHPPLTDTEVRRIATSISRYAPDAGQGSVSLVGFTLDELKAKVFTDRRALLMRGESAIFREGHIGQVTAERGIGKTWFLLTLALAAASGSRALGFLAPSPCRVLYVDGEMASTEIQERICLLADRMEVHTTTNLTIVAADWQDAFLPRVDSDVGQAGLEPFVQAADLIFLDNRSCLTDPESEKDAAAWQPTQDWLLSLRRRGKAVIVAHHSNRQGGARGHSKPEDVMNLLVRLTRPVDYSQDQGARFNVIFDKSRGAYGPAVATFEAHLGAEGWRVQTTDGVAQTSASRKLLDYVRLAQATGDRPRSASIAVSKARVSRNQGFSAWAQLLNTGSIIKHPDGGYCVP